MEEVLLYFSYIHNGDWTKIYDSIKKKEVIDINLLTKIKSECNCQYITILSSDYPRLLKHVNKPPFVIYYKGKIELLNDGLIFAVIGSRTPTSNGIKITKELTTSFVKHDITIISGLAKGIDSVAHQTAIDLNGKTIAVLGNGIEQFYPSENEELQNKIREKGLLISEYPPFVKADKTHFPIRNRIIAALANAIIVGEAKLKSGSQITVSYGIEMGKEIYCVPSSCLENSACNYLIKQGASLIENANDVLADFNLIKKNNML